MDSVLVVEDHIEVPLKGSEIKHEDVQHPREKDDQQHDETFLPEETQEKLSLYLLLARLLGAISASAVDLLQLHVDPHDLFKVKQCAHLLNRLQAIPVLVLPEVVLRLHASKTAAGV